MDTRLVPWVALHEQDWTILTVSAESGPNDDVRDFVDKRLVELAEESFAGRYSKFINTRWKALIALECENDAVIVKLACPMPIERHVLQSNNAKRVRQHIDDHFSTVALFDININLISRDLKLPFYFVEKVVRAYNKHQTSKRRKQRKKEERCKKNSPRMI